MDAGAAPPLVRSPLLIARRARSAGGRGGRRVELHRSEDGAYRIVVAGDVSRTAEAIDRLAAVQHFNAAVAAVAIDRLAAVQHFNAAVAEAARAPG